MKRAFALLLLVAVVVVPDLAGAADLQDDLANVNSRIDSINAEINAANAGRTGVVDDIVTTRDQLELMQTELTVTRQDLAATEAQKSERQAALDLLRGQLEVSYRSLTETRQDLSSSQDTARNWVRARYLENGDGRGTLAFSADSVTNVYLGLGYLELIAADTDREILRYESLQVQEERQQVRIQSEEAGVADEVAGLADLEARLALLEQRQADQAATVEADLATLHAKLDAVDEAVAQFNTELNGLEGEQAKIEKLIEEETSKGGDTPGILIRPVPGRITSRFGPRLHPILGNIRMHTGTDFATPRGQPIKAAASGRVILAGPYGGYGNAVVIDHGGGMTTLYAHQSKLKVSYGEQVSAGEIIGYAGSTGLATGPNLHFEVRINGVPVDPEGYL